MSAEPKRRRAANCFKKDWLDETVITTTPTSHNDQRVYLRWISWITDALTTFIFNLLNYITLKLF